MKKTKFSKKKKVVIFGSGWAGLSCALELSEFSDLDIHLCEIDDTIGGKTKDTVIGDGRIKTHAIRLVSDYYHAFADICSRVPLKEGSKKTLLDRWSEVEYMNFSSFRTKKTIHSLSRRTSPDLKEKISLIQGLRSTFNFRLIDMLHIWRKLNLFRNLSGDEKAKLREDKITITEYLELSQLSESARKFVLDYLGITVAAKETSLASMSMDLMSKMFVGVARTHLFETDSKRGFRTWVIDGPLGDRLVQPLAHELRRRGVTFHLNTGIEDFGSAHEGLDTIEVANLTSGDTIEADAFVLALNNKVLEELGFVRQLQGLQNEWSIGATFTLPYIPKVASNIHPKSVNAVMDSLWRIVYVIWRNQSHGGFNLERP